MTVVTGHALALATLAVACLVGGRNICRKCGVGARGGTSCFCLVVFVAKRWSSGRMFCVRQSYVLQKPRNTYVEEQESKLVAVRSTDVSSSPVTTDSTSRSMGHSASGSAKPLVARPSGMRGETSEASPDEAIRVRENRQAEGGPSFSRHDPSRRPEKAKGIAVPRTLVIEDSWGPSLCVVSTVTVTGARAVGKRASKT